jgi:hypothetical protein
MLPVVNMKNGRRWNSVDHFSLLSYASIPDDSIDFFTPFIRELSERWIELCDGTLQVMIDFMATEKALLSHKIQDSQGLVVHVE